GYFVFDYILQGGFVHLRYRLHINETVLALINAKHVPLKLYSSSPPLNLSLLTYLLQVGPAPVLKGRPKIAFIDFHLAFKPADMGIFNRLHSLPNFSEEAMDLKVVSL